MAAATFFLIVIGLLHACSPQTAWYLSTGWKIRDAEPSEAALVMFRVGGIAAIAIIMLIHASSTTHTARITAETNIRGGLMNPFDSMTSSTFQFKLADPFDGHETAEEHQVKQLILDSTWEKAADHDGVQGEPSVKGEIELHLNDGHGSTMYWFCFGDADFGIGRDQQEPEYVFTSEPLKTWLEAHTA